MAEQFPNQEANNSSEIVPNPAESQEGSADEDKGTQEGTAAAGVLLEQQREAVDREQFVEEMKIKHGGKSPSTDPEKEAKDSSSKATASSNKGHSSHGGSAGDGLVNTFTFFGLMWSWFTDMVKKSSGGKSAGGGAKKDDHGGGGHH